MPLREYPLQGSSLGKHVVLEDEVTQVVVVADSDYLMYVIVAASMRITG